MLKYKIPQIVTLIHHYERILNYFVNRSTNAAAEAFNAKIVTLTQCFSYVSAEKDKPLQTFDLQEFIFLFSYPDPGSNRDGSESTGV